jgi:hypothetical protein
VVEHTGETNQFNTMQYTSNPSQIPIGSQPIPNNYFPTVEGSVLAALALFLIRGLWQEHCKDEKAERELVNKLLDYQAKKDEKSN